MPNHFHWLFNIDSVSISILSQPIGTGCFLIFNTGTEIVLSNGACEIRIAQDHISINNGQIKIGLAGVSLANGAMSFGTPP